MSVRKLFKEYHTEYPDGYQLSSFKRIVSEYRFHIKVVGHVEHYAAEQMYIDFAGDRLEVVDEMTGETKKAEVFVAILPFSHYTYCEAVWSQRKEDLIKACENAIQYFEGVPAAIVPDNLKAAVTRSDRNEPVINDDFAAFAEYYGCVVYPARVRHPKDKALVENAVKLLYRSIYLDIEGMTFSSLEELNTAIHISLLDFNEKVMAGREMSRKEIFLHGEKDYLRPLPVKRYVMKERKLMTVGKNSYVSLFKHHYSVPKEYVGRRMTILYDADTVEIYCGMNLVATHDRCDIPYTYSWKKEHNLPGHYGPERENTALQNRIIELEEEARQRERQQAKQMQEMKSTYEQQNGKLSEFVNFVKCYFPYVEKLIPTINFLRDRLGFDDGIIRRLCTFKDVAIKGKLYSSEFNQSFETKRSICAIKENENGKFDFNIDGVPHVSWFRKKMSEFREAIGIPKPRQNRGIKL